MISWRRSESQSLKTVGGEENQSGDAELNWESADFWSLSRALLENSSGIPVHPPPFHTDSFTCVWRQTSPSTLSPSVRFSIQKNKGRGLQLCRTATACLGFRFVSRTTLEKRLLWAVVKDHSKPLAGGQEKQSDGCSCSMSLPLIISLAFP